MEDRTKSLFYNAVRQQMEKDQFMDSANSLVNNLQFKPYSTNEDLYSLYCQSMNKNTRKQKYELRNFSNRTKDTKYHLPNEYTTKYITTHKGAVRDVAFSREGRYLATGSADCSIKVLDVNRLHEHLTLRKEVSSTASMTSKPVIRTFYDHGQRVNSLVFTPQSNILVSGGDDFTIRFFQVHKKKSFHSFEEINPILDMAVHPNQEWLLVACQDPLLRKYNLVTNHCYVVLQAKNASIVKCVDYSYTGKYYVCGTQRGMIKIFDGRVNDVIHQMDFGQLVYNIKFSKNGRYFLASGEDFKPRLFDFGTRKEIMKYDYMNNKGKTVRSENPPQVVERNSVVFSYDERKVLTSVNKKILVFNLYTGVLEDVIETHNRFVRCLAYSPKEDSFVSGSDDSRARFYVRSD